MTGGDTGVISLWSITKKKAIFTVPLAHGLDPVPLDACKEMAAPVPGPLRDWQRETDRRIFLGKSWGRRTAHVEDWC